MQIPLFCALIELIDEGTEVTPPENVVYSTQPRKATALDGYSYYIKGPDLNVVIAEAVAHQLARSLNLNVPEFGVAVPEGSVGPLFASREVKRCQRQVDPWIVRGGATNRDSLPHVTAFDVWVMNKDRNIGNLVGEEQVSPSEGRISIVAIDFEKSMALRGPYPLTTTPHIEPRSLWPSGTLGELLTGDPLPSEFCGALERMSKDHVLDAFGQVEAQIKSAIPWKESSAQLLSTRAKNIRRLVGEVWR